MLNPMNILIAPNAFKGNLSALEVAEILASGLRGDEFHVSTFPIADGGDGSLDVFLHVFSGVRETVEVFGPLGVKIKADWGWIGEDIAFIEMSNASGIKLLKENDLDPLRASSFGTGQLIKRAIEKGAKQIYIGIGGSATVDGGVGMLNALGVRFFDKKENEIDDQTIINEFDNVDLTKVWELMEGIDITVLSDVDNPLLGANGAAHVFGPQKGASPKVVEILENRLISWSSLLISKTGVDFRNLKGAGAAGGVGYALATVARASLVNGFRFLLENSLLKKVIAECDVLITGEGKIDDQTLLGKGPGEIAAIAKNEGKICIGVCGIMDTSIGAGEFFNKIYPLVDGDITRELAMQHSRDLLLEGASKIRKFLKAV